MKIDKNKKLLGFGEIMQRLSPTNNQKIIQATSFDATYSGAEANVMASLSLLGHNTKFFTKLPNNSLGQKVLSVFRGYNVDMSDVILCEDRLGVYYVELGFSSRSTEVIYDRKNSAISLMKKEDVNIPKVLDGISLLHLTGITQALSKELREIMLDMVKYAKQNNIVVCFDSNFRSNLWTSDEAKIALENILPYVDIAFLGYLDMTKILGYEDDKNLSYEENLELLYKKLLNNYPNIQIMASTKRIVNSTTNNTLSAYLFDGNILYKSKQYTFDILDRVGGGDAFTAGILHGLLEEMDYEKVVNFGVCASVLKHSIKGDINLSDKNSIISLMENNIASVKR